MDGQAGVRAEAAIPSEAPSTPSPLVPAAQLSSLALTLRVLKPLLARPEVTDI